MYKIIGADRKEYGPVSADQLRQWIRENRANAQTMVQPEGATAWIPLGQCPEFAADFAASAAAIPPLSTLPPSPQDRFGIGTPPAQDREVRVMECLRRAWRLVAANLGLLVGASSLILLITIGTNFFPIIGPLVIMIIQGPLMGGLFALYLRRIRGQEARLNDAFSGFGQAFVQLMVTQVITSLLIMLSAVLFFVGVMIVMVFSRSIVASVFGGMLCCVGLIPAVYLSVAWMFVLPLVIDKKLDFSEAMSLSRKTVHPHWWNLFGLYLLSILVGVCGLIILGVGILFTLPVCYCAWMYAYEDFFGGGTEIPS